MRKVSGATSTKQAHTSGGQQISLKLVSVFESDLQKWLGHVLLKGIDWLVEGLERDRDLLLTNYSLSICFTNFPLAERFPE